MNIKDFGGEFKLIEKITRKITDENVIVGVGDDTAIIRSNGRFLLLTTDMLCEGDHFSLDYFTPRQIGIKAMVSNQSDIAAMGGIPLYAMVSLALTKDIQVEIVEGIYVGLYEACEKYGGIIVGGDITHSTQMVINISLLGEVKNEKYITRSGANAGDKIYVSGSLGGSTAGLKLFLDNIKGFEAVKKCHTEPFPRFDISREVSHYATSMEDVSDGLASEVRNIAQASGTGAVIFADNVPIEDEVHSAAGAVGQSALDYALYGGEDFELVYTVPREFTGSVPGYLVGEIIEGSDIILETKGVKQKLTRFGFDHFG